MEDETEGNDDGSPFGGGAGEDKSQGEGDSPFGEGEAGKDSGASPSEREKTAKSTGTKTNRISNSRGSARAASNESFYQGSGNILVVFVIMGMVLMLTPICIFFVAVKVSKHRKQHTEGQKAQGEASPALAITELTTIKTETPSNGGDGAWTRYFHEASQRYYISNGVETRWEWLQGCHLFF